MKTTNDLIASIREDLLTTGYDVEWVTNKNDVSVDIVEAILADINLFSLPFSDSLDLDIESDNSSFPIREFFLQPLNFS